MAMAEPVKGRPLNETRSLFTVQNEEDVLLLLEYDTETHQLKFLTADITHDEAFSFTVMDTGHFSARSYFKDIPCPSFHKYSNELILLGPWLADVHRPTATRNPICICSLARHFAPAELIDTNMYGHYSALIHGKDILYTTTYSGSSAHISRWNHDVQGSYRHLAYFHSPSERDSTGNYITPKFQVFAGSDITQRTSASGALDYLYCFGQGKGLLYIDIIKSRHFNSLKLSQAKQNTILWNRTAVSAVDENDRNIMYSPHLTPLLVPCKSEGGYRSYVFGAYSEPDTPHKKTKNRTTKPEVEDCFELNYTWIDVLSDGWIPNGPEITASVGAVSFSLGQGDGQACKPKFWIDSPVVAKLVDGQVWLFYTSQDGKVECAVAGVDMEGNLVGWKRRKMRMPGDGEEAERGGGRKKHTVCFVPRGVL